MLKKVGILLCVFMLLVVGSALAQAPKKGGTLIYGRGGDSVGLDPGIRDRRKLLYGLQ